MAAKAGVRDALEFRANPRIGAQVAASPQLTAVLNMLCLMVVREARKRAPVDTGRLRNSITHRIVPGPTGPVGEVGTNVEYAAPQEFGTRLGVPATRFLGGALHYVAGQLAARAATRR